MESKQSKTFYILIRREQLLQMHPSASCQYTKSPRISDRFLCTSRKMAAPVPCLGMPFYTCMSRVEAIEFIWQHHAGNRVHGRQIARSSTTLAQPNICAETKPAAAPCTCTHGWTTAPWPPGTRDHQISWERRKYYTFELHPNLGPCYVSL